MAVFKEWINSLPEGSVDIESLIHSGFPSTAKRVVAYREKGTTEMGLAVNSMGTHLPDEFYADYEIVSSFNP